MIRTYRPAFVARQLRAFRDHCGHNVRKAAVSKNETPALISFCITIQMQLIKIVEPPSSVKGQKIDWGFPSQKTKIPLNYGL